MIVAVLLSLALVMLESVASFKAAHKARLTWAEYAFTALFTLEYLLIVLIMGTVMCGVEGPENGFTSIPVSVYWAICTVTTVGCGDITPKTDLGRAIASVMMLLGWGVLAVPTGNMTAEMAAQRIGEAAAPTTRSCHACLREGLQADSHFCRHCGTPLPEYQRD